MSAEMPKKRKLSTPKRGSSVILLGLALVIGGFSSNGLLSCDTGEKRSAEEENALIEQYGVCERDRYVGSRSLNQWLERGYVVQENETVVGGAKLIHLSTKVPCDRYGQPLPTDGYE